MPNALIIYVPGLSLSRHEGFDELGAAFCFGGGAERCFGLEGDDERFLLTGGDDRFFLTGGDDERLLLVEAGLVLVLVLRRWEDEPELLTLLRRRRVGVVDLRRVGVVLLRRVGVVLLLRRLLVLLVRRLLLLPELVVVLLVVLLLVLLRGEEFLLVVVSVSSSESFVLGAALVINLLGLIGCTLILAFLPVNFGRSGNFSTGIPSVASFINSRQV